MINNDQSTLLLYYCENVKSHRSGGDTVPLTAGISLLMMERQESQLGGFARSEFFLVQTFQHPDLTFPNSVSSSTLIRLTVLQNPLF